MTRLKFLTRTLLHFRLANLAVILGMAIASAILTGALMVGDSVKQSLYNLTLQRLGPIDYTLAPGRFFPEDLSARIAASPNFKQSFDQAIPAIHLRGGALNENTSARAASVQITAFAGGLVPVTDNHAILNEPLAGLLKINPGRHTLVLSLPTIDDTPRDATFARRSRDDTLAAMRVDVERVVAEPNLASLFTLTGTQRPTLNLWTNLKNLQQALDQPNRANLLLVTAAPKTDQQKSLPILNDIIKQVHRLDDYSLTLDKSPDGRDVILNSATTYISPPIDRAATQAAKNLNLPLQKASVYLINQVTNIGADVGARLASPSPQMHYAIAAGLNHLDNQPLNDDQIILNQWAADRLRAKIGDKLRLSYYKRQPAGDLIEVTADQLFTLTRILPMTGLGADPSLTPKYKGLTDSPSVADWDAPAGLEINKKLITPEDEAYWKNHRASPKLFVSLATAQKLWGSTYGDINSIRIPAAHAAEFEKELLSQINPQDLALSFLPIKSQQLAAATSGTDFAQLFVAFSFFVIAAAAILLAMLFRLSIEQRSRQFGLLAALGFSPKQIRRLALYEGMLLSIIGALIGLLLASLYTQFIIYALRTWWVNAIGTTALSLHILPQTLLIGFFASLFIALIAIFWSVRRLSSTNSTTLLAGGFDLAATAKSKRRFAPSLTLASLIPALGLLVLGAINKIPQATAFLSAGSLLLISTLAAIAILLRLKRHETAHLSIASLGLRNAARRRARSLMTIALIAFASFTLVTVASMKAQPPRDTANKRSGTGGYQLILQADHPLLGDLNTKAGRDILGIRDTENPLWSRAKFTPMRTWAGQDISCLNLTRPTAPTILSVPTSLAQADRFEFAKEHKTKESRWKLLDQKTVDLRADAPTIPVITDDETATYILKLKLGEYLPITDQIGRAWNLKLVATLSHSMLQSELLMSEENFAKLFPNQSGAGTVLIECPSADMQPLQLLLNSELEDYAITVEPTADRLARYQQVANTYLSTFQTLGSLGLLLGTVGLAILLLRSLIERRSELALLAALGWRPLRRLSLLLAENSLLLILGLFTGTLCAMIAILPSLLSSNRNINLPQLFLTLGSILLTGLIVLTLATLLATRRLSPASLRAE